MLQSGATSNSGTQLPPELCATCPATRMWAAVVLRWYIASY